MTTAGSEVWRLGALELAREIADRRISSREAVEAHLRRIETVDPAVNAVPVVLAERAIQAATDADLRQSNGGDLGRFHGVPFTVKGNIDLEGTPTTHGSRLLAEACPERSAPAVERLLAAGAIPIGRTNLATFAIRWHTESELWGSTVNPWDPARTPGASSGGEGVALATGMSPLGLGNDGLGSLRWPAACCGVAALKPTLGRIPTASSTGGPDPPIGIQLTAVDGPMARRVADLRAALETLAGPSPRDPWSTPAPLAGPDPARPIRVAVAATPCGRAPDPRITAALELAAATLDGAGYALEEAEPPSITDAAAVLMRMLATPEIRSSWNESTSFMPEPTRRFMDSFHAVAGDPDAVTSLLAFVDRASIARAWSSFLEDRPLILAPISCGLPFAPGEDLTVAEVSDIVRDLGITMAVNALGLPAVAVPVGVRDGLPLVVQIIGSRFREDLCLDAAEALEDRLGIFTPIDPVRPSDSSTPRVAVDGRAR